MNYSANKTTLPKWMIYIFYGLFGALILWSLLPWSWMGMTIGREVVESPIVELLTAGGYPQTARCVKCGQTIDRFDWHDSGKISGPAHFSPCPEV